MKIKSTLIAFSVLGIFALASCKSPQEEIAKKWQVTSLEDQKNDSMAQAYLKSIDTMSVIDPVISMAYGIDNLDSMKKIMREDAQSEIDQRKESAKLINIDFRKNGDVFITSGDKVDSSKVWNIVDKNTLIMKAKNPTETGAFEDSFTIQKLTSNELKLKMQQVQRGVYLNMRPFSKKDSTEAIEVMERFKKLQEENRREQEEMEKTNQEQLENS